MRQQQSPLEPKFARRDPAPPAGPRRPPEAEVLRGEGRDSGGRNPLRPAQAADQLDTRLGRSGHRRRPGPGDGHGLVATRAAAGGGGRRAAGKRSGHPSPLAKPPGKLARGARDSPEAHATWTTPLGQNLACGNTSPGRLASPRLAPGTARSTLRRPRRTARGPPTPGPRHPPEDLGAKSAFRSILCAKTSGRGPRQSRRHRRNPTFALC